MLSPNCLHNMSTLTHVVIYNIYVDGGCLVVPGDPLPRQALVPPALLPMVHCAHPGKIPLHLLIIVLFTPLLLF